MGLVSISQSAAVNPNFVIGFDNETNEVHCITTEYYQLEKRFDKLWMCCLVN